MDLERAQKLRASVDERIKNLTEGPEILTGEYGQPLLKKGMFKVWSNTGINQF